MSFAAGVVPPSRRLTLGQQALPAAAAAAAPVLPPGATYDRVEVLSIVPPKEQRVLLKGGARR